MSRNSAIFLTILVITVALACAAGSAAADSSPAAHLVASKRSPVVDIEVDPIAYALSGFSLHAGVTWNRFRLDLGAFALEMPEAMHGAEGLTVHGSGFGAKLDYHPLSRLRSAFVGVQLSRARETITAETTGESSAEHHTMVGARIGYRVRIARGFYALPWIGVDVSLSSRTQHAAGIEYKPGRAVFFPTVHLGKRF